MNRTELGRLLELVSSGDLSVENALGRLSRWPFEQSGGVRKTGGAAAVRFDHHRELRTGIPEVIYGEGKEPATLVGLFGRAVAAGRPLLATRVSERVARLVGKRVAGPEYLPQARCLRVGPLPRAARSGGVAVLAAGTTDLPVAEEAAVTLEFLGRRVLRRYDVGVAGLHRLVSVLPDLEGFRALVVVAGLEGALPSVVAGLVDVPVVAVPTSVGYGASFGGIAPLLAMMNSCAPGVSVVNIDNGFGGAVVAAKIDRLGPRGSGKRKRGKPPA